MRRRRARRWTPRGEKQLEESCPLGLGRWACRTRAKRVWEKKKSKEALTSTEFWGVQHYCGVQNYCGKFMKTIFVWEAASVDKFLTFPIQKKTKIENSCRPFRLGGEGLSWLISHLSHTNANKNLHLISRSSKWSRDRPKWSRDRPEIELDQREQKHLFSDNRILYPSK